MCDSCQKKISGMKKKKKGSGRARVRGMGKMSTKGLVSLATETVLPIAAGAVAGQYANKLPYLEDNPDYIPVANLGVGLVGASMTKGFVQKALLGVAINGAIRLADQLLDNPAGQNGMGAMPVRLRNYGGSSSAAQGMRMG